MDNNILCFGLESQYFAIDSRCCQKIIPFSSIDFISNDLLTKDTNIDDFFYLDNAILPFVDLSQKLCLDLESTISNVLIVSIDNKRTGLKIVFDSIYLTQIKDNDIFAFEKGLEENIISSFIKDESKNIEISMLNLLAVV